MAIQLRLLISEQEFKTLAPVSGALQMETPLAQYIYDAGERYVRPILCEDLYEDLLTAYKDGTLSPSYTVLRERYVAPAVAWQALKLYLPIARLRVREAGPIIQNPTNATGGAQSDVVYLRKQVEESANTYLQRLQDYLSKNSEEFPLYNCGKCDYTVDHHGYPEHYGTDGLYRKGDRIAPPALGNLMDLW